MRRRMVRRRRSFRGRSSVRRRRGGFKSRRRSVRPLRIGYRF